MTLNGIAQGFAADRVGEVFRSHGITGMLSLIRAEFGALGRKPDGKPWQIGIQHPRVREAYAALAAVERSVSLHFRRLRNEVQRRLFQQPHF
jgi:thiamine biosynthesis lipoprotein